MIHGLIDSKFRTHTFVIDAFIKNLLCEQLSELPAFVLIRHPSLRNRLREVGRQLIWAILTDLSGLMR